MISPIKILEDLRWEEAACVCCVAFSAGPMLLYLLPESHATRLDWGTRPPTAGMAVGPENAKTRFPGVLHGCLKSRMAIFYCFEMNIGR